MFTSAVAYDGMMGRWSARLAPMFTAFACVEDGERVLDVGCGTGCLVRTVAAMTHRSGIVGIDPAQPFVDFCRTTFDDPRITFDRGSASELPYASGSFDQTLSLLVLTFLPEPETAANEMRRVTRPGGTVAACNWHPTGLEMNEILWEEAARVDPAAKARVKGRSYHEGQLAELWRATGLERVQETAFEIRTEFSSFDDYWLPFTKGVGPQGVYLATLSLDQREALRQALRERLIACQPDGRFSLKARALAVRGTVP